jgi:hypothetical protein
MGTPNITVWSTELHRDPHDIVHVHVHVCINECNYTYCTHIHEHVQYVDIGDVVRFFITC